MIVLRLGKQLEKHKLSILPAHFTWNRWSIFFTHFLIPQTSIQNIVPFVGNGKLAPDKLSTGKWFHLKILSTIKVLCLFNSCAVQWDVSKEQDALLVSIPSSISNTSTIIPAWNLTIQYRPSAGSILRSLHPKCRPVSVPRLSGP